MPYADAEQARAAAVVAALASAGTDAETPIGLVVVPGAGIALATDSGRWTVRAPAGAVLAALEAEWAPRWTWWSAAGSPLVGAGVRPLRCWDAGAVHKLLRGGRREDPAAVWAAANDLPEPPAARPRRDAADGTGLLDLGGDAPGSLVAEDGQLTADAADGSALRAADVGADVALRRAAELAELVLVVRDAQELELEDLPDPRPEPRGPRLALQTAWSESAAALLAVELGADGLPLDRARAEELLTAVLGPSPADERGAAAQRAARDAAVADLFTGRAPGADRADDVDRIDLRSSAQVLRALQRIGLDVPDTRGWRLERHRGAHPAVDALLEWRRAERLDSTYGRAWLAERVGSDSRLRGAWSASDGGGGRMTAQAGLHNLPAELRPAVVAEAGHVFVRADLGQVEPRVLAAVSGDPALVAATHEDDLYLPVAEQLGSDRATAKIAVLAAMYGQTSGDAGRALQRMEAAYPTALAHLRAAEAAGREGHDLRTHGGRLLRLAEAAERAAAGGGAAGPGPEGGEGVPGGGDLQGRGRFARNAVVQGAAAELFKAWAATVRIALLRSEAATAATDPGAGPSGAPAAPGAVAGRIVLCLHDELLLHVPEASADAVQELLHRSLDAAAGRWAAGSGVRFVAEVSAVRTWAEAK